MVLVLFAVTGFIVGYRLEMSRAGYIAMALTTLTFGVGQIVLLFVAKSREAMTLLPLVVGLAIVLFMLLGALTRLFIRGRPNAA